LTVSTEPWSSEGTLEKLSRVAVKSAEYDSRERRPHSKCLEGTRVDLLSYIQGLLDNSEQSRLIWLHGMAGVGKSAVAFTVAERLKVTHPTVMEKRIAGTFFFSRKYTKRSTAGYFFATLAYQLATNFPSVRDDVNRAIRENPSLLDPGGSLRDQMEALFLRPLRALQLRLRGCLPLVFVIDALDECPSESETTELISLLAQALREPDLPAIHILLTSRAEARIRKAIQKEEVRPLVSEIPVETSGKGVPATISLDGADVDNDIYIYLRHSFGELHDRHPDFPLPTGYQLWRLASRAGRRFIVASTMMGFIDDRDNDPRDRLHIMLDLTSDLLPGTEVYKLYDNILSTCADPMRAYFHLSVVVALADPLPISQISKLLGPGPGRDVETALVQLRSVMDIPTDSSLPVNIYHSSVRDYASDPSNCSLAQVQSLISPHTLLARSSFRLMMEEIPESTALLDALSVLNRQTQARQHETPQSLKHSLAFIVEPPEPLQALIGLLWLQGDHGSDLQCWLETPDGHAWLQTQEGKDWLRSLSGKGWLQTQEGKDWLQTQGGKDWLQTWSGGYWLKTEGGRDWLLTERGHDWLRTRGGYYWLQTWSGTDWLEVTKGGEYWLQTRGGHDWLETRSGQEWLCAVSSPHSESFLRVKRWLSTQGGEQWQLTQGGQYWLQHTRSGRDWLQDKGSVPRTRESRPQIIESWGLNRGRLASKTLEDLQSSLERLEFQTISAQDEDQLMIHRGQDWLHTEQAQRLYIEGVQDTRGTRQLTLPERAVPERIQTPSERDWLQTQIGLDWLQTHMGREWLLTQEGGEWLQAKDGREWLQTQEQDWLQTHGGQEWLRSEGGCDWLQSPGGCDWLQTESGKYWLQSLGRQHWLKTEGGRDWLQTQGGRDWLQTRGGHDWLQTHGSHDWLQTENGRHWLRTEDGRGWLQTDSGESWLQTPGGQAWQTTPAASVWVTLEEFSDTLEAIGDYTPAPELSLTPAFKVIEEFRSLSHSLMFPVFLSLRHQDHSTSALPYGRFPKNIEIIKAMIGFVYFANEALERSLSSSEALEYACQNWVIHLSEALDAWDDVLAHLFETFWDRYLLSWLERQWCLKGLRSCLIILSEGQELAKVCVFTLMFATQHLTRVS
jgi:hypothetical protein